MNTFCICLCILATIIINPSNATLGDLFGGGEEAAPQQGPSPQVRQIQQLGQLAQTLQMFAPNPAQILNTVGMYGPQLLELANQAQKLFSEDENSSQQQQSPLPQLSYAQIQKPSFQQGPGQGLGQQGPGQGQGHRYGPPMRQQHPQQQPRQHQQQQSQPPSFSFNKFSPSSESQEGYSFDGPEFETPEVIHIHRHIIEHVDQSSGSGLGSGLGSGSGSGYGKNSQNGENVRIIKIIHEQANGYGNGNGNGYSYGHGNSIEY